MNPIEAFKQERQQRIADQATNQPLQASAESFLEQTIRSGYSYNFSWMGRPIIQYPQDMVMMQELIWEIKPDLIIETGIAHGGSIIFYASLLELIGKGEVLGIDIDIRQHNREEIERHPMFKRIKMIEGSAVSPEVAARVTEVASKHKTVMVCLDSNHTHEHVLQELELYSPLVSVGSYLVVFDTVVEFLPDGALPKRPWGKGDNPWSATQAFLKTHPGFEIDRSIDNKLLIGVAPEGYLKRVR
jgi:cephalosporin hydroxylase